MQEISRLRQELDHLHQEMVTLFQKRLEIAEAIWRLKNKDQIPLQDPQREAEILSQIVARARNSDEQDILRNWMYSTLELTKEHVKKRLE